MKNKKILIAYYSHSGNTKAVSEKIQEITNGDIFEIIPSIAYPTNYNSVINQVKSEKENNYYVSLKDNGNIEEYDVIFIGTPVWWYTMATPLKTFFRENNFEGKIVVPFCTHGGGGASFSYSDMQKLAPKAKFLEGFTSKENFAELDDVKKWIDSLSL